jgi:hypothetical protein
MLLITHESQSVFLREMEADRTSGAVEVCDAGDISRAALRLSEEARCAVWRGCPLDLRVLAGREGKRRSGEEDDGGGEFHLGKGWGVCGNVCESVDEIADGVFQSNFKWPRTVLLYGCVDGYFAIRFPFRVG